MHDGEVKVLWNSGFIGVVELKSMVVLAVAMVLEIEEV